MYFEVQLNLVFLPASLFCTQMSDLHENLIDDEIMRRALFNLENKFFFSFILIVC